MKKHRLEVHATDSILSYFNCSRCEELEEEYAEAITYHVSRITSDIFAEGRRLRRHAASGTCS